MKLKPILLAALLAGLSFQAFAEEAGGDEKKVEKHEFRIVTPDAGAWSGDFDGAFRFHDKPVKNAPYSAEVVSETMQALADGNQISRKNVLVTYRDSAGRTRQEMRDAKGEVKTVFIRGDGATWILRPADKTATKLPSPDDTAALQAHAEAARAGAEAARKAAEASRDASRKAVERARERVEQLRKEGKLEEGQEIMVRRVERVDGEPGKQMEDVRVRVMKDVENRGPEMAARIAPVIVNAFGDMRWSKNATTKDLGARDFNGVKATGKLRSYEIPAGEVGNIKPIAISEETWYSPDLQVTVYQKHSDPRSGERIYRLENLKREEPAASLFSVPADYKVKDVMANVRTRIEKFEKFDKTEKTEKK
ncbi:MAG: hypothetical protein ACXU8N_04980 [Telluria sp.]